MIIFIIKFRINFFSVSHSSFACTVFAYGQTSTGKTYTLTGNAFQFARYSSAGNSAKKTSSSSSNKRRSKSQPPDSINESLNIDETMKNSSPNIGIIQLSFAYLFEQIKRRKSRDQTLLYIITVSYLEVYNEQVKFFKKFLNLLILNHHHLYWKLWIY